MASSWAASQEGTRPPQEERGKLEERGSPVSGSVVVRSKAEVGPSWNVKLFWAEPHQGQAGEDRSEAEAGGIASMGRGLDVASPVPLAPRPRAYTTNYFLWSPCWLPKTKGADQSPLEAPGVGRPPSNHSDPWLLVLVADPGNLLAERLPWLGGDAGDAGEGVGWEEGRTPAQTRTRWLPAPSGLGSVDLGP